MASSSATPKSPHQSTYENFESNLQPFYVLHRASSSSNKAEGKSNGTVKTRRRIDLSSPSKPKGAAVKSENDERDEAFYENLRMEAWKFIWTKMESSIKNALTEVNTNVFDEINRWVQKSFTTIRSFGSPSFAEATRSLPIAIDANVKRLFTGLVLTKNIEFVDDLMTFRNLGSHLKSHGCLVANLSSPDFSAKNGISGCLRRFLRQFLASPLDAADMFTFASWYRELGYQDKPVVIIIEDMERCCGHVLSNFILMLSEWVVKVPVILIMGVATTLDAPKNIFSSNALQQLCPCKFSFGSPTERMDAVIETVLVRQFSTLSIGYEVAVFLKNYFLNQDGTLTSFIRALKIACDLHFSTEPLSFILGGLHDDDNKDDKHAFSLEMLLKYASQIHSYQRYQSIQQSDSDLAHCLSELKRSRKSWSFAVLCLYEAGKYSKVRLLDILCEALDPDFHEPMASENPTGLAGAKGGSISQAVRKVRDLPTALLQQLLLSWQKLSIDVPEIRDKVTELLSTLKLEDGKRLNQDLADIPNMHALRSHVSMQDRNSTNEKAFSLIKSLVRLGIYLNPLILGPSYLFGG